MTHSLRFRLAVTVLSILMVALAGFALVLDTLLERALRQQFDKRLLGRRDRDRRHGGRLPVAPEFEYASLPEFERPTGPPTSRRGSTTVACSRDRRRSAPENLSRALPPKASPTYFDAALPDGRPAERSSCANRFASILPAAAKERTAAPLDS